MYRQRFYCGEDISHWYDEPSTSSHLDCDSDSDSDIIPPTPDKVTSQTTKLNILTPVFIM